MTKTWLLSVCICYGALSGKAQQNDFDKYGPFSAPVEKDLKTVFKEKPPKKVFKLDLDYQHQDSVLYPRIGELKELQAIRFNGLNIRDYPKNFEALSNLVYFGSFNTRLTGFPPVLKSYPNLMHLELQHSLTDSVPAAIAYLNRLQTLRIGNTNDTLKLPNTLRYLRNLKELSIDNCVLDSMPTDVFKITSLKYLLLSNTNTWFLPKQFEGLPNLEVLVVENNALTAVPFEIYKAQKLRIVALRGNKLRKLPETLAQLPDLQVLDVRGNPLDKAQIELLKSLLPGCEIKF